MSPAGEILSWMCVEKSLRSPEIRFHQDWWLEAVPSPQLPTLKKSTLVFPPRLWRGHFSLFCSHPSPPSSEDFYRNGLERLLQDFTSCSFINNSLKRSLTPESHGGVPDTVSLDPISAHLFFIFPRQTSLPAERPQHQIHKSILSILQP